MLKRVLPKVLLFSMTVLFGACTAPQEDSTAFIEVPVPIPVLLPRTDWAQQLADSGVAGTFVLWEPDSGRLQASDTARANRGYLPASTFKLFNSLVSLQEGAVPDENTVLPWDKVERYSPDWNQDLSMRQALPYSAAWFYQETARRVGVERMQHWLDTVDYGNRLIGDSIHTLWIRGGLRITPLEQVRFVEALHDEALPFDVAHQRTVKRIMPGDSAATWRIQAKTGWAALEEQEYGWYVGWVERGGGTAYFAIHLDIASNEDARKRYTATHALLQRAGWIDAPHR